jgi:hypothetical protein
VNYQNVNRGNENEFCIEIGNPYKIIVSHKKLLRLSIIVIDKKEVKSKRM